MSDNEKPNYWGILPAIVRYDQNLTCMQKIMFAEISALQNSKGVCFASNQYFGSLYQVHKNTAGKWINKLEKQGYIKSEIKYKPDSKQVDKRLLFVCIDPINQNVDTPINKKIDTPQSKDLYPINKKIEDNNTSINNEEEENIYKNTREAIRQYQEIFVKQYKRQLLDYKPFLLDNDYEVRLMVEFRIEDFEIPQYQHEFMDYLISHNKEYPDLQVSFYRHLKGKFERGIK